MGDISVVVRLTLIANLLSASLARYGRWHRPSIYISVIISCHQIVSLVYDNNKLFSGLACSYHVIDAFKISLKAMACSELFDFISIGK